MHIYVYNSLWPLTTIPQGLQKINNWGGGGLIFIYLCSVSLICFEIDCFYNLGTQIYEYQPPQLSIFCRLCNSCDKHLCKALKFHHLFYLLDIYIAFHGFPFHKAFLRGVCFASRKSFFLVLGNYIHFAEDPPSFEAHFTYSCWDLYKPNSLAAMVDSLHGLTWPIDLLKWLFHFTTFFGSLRWIINYVLAKRQKKGKYMLSKS